jgi:Tol biopolymer transport system component
MRRIVERAARNELARLALVTLFVGIFVQCKKSSSPAEDDTPIPNPERMLPDADVEEAAPPPTDSGSDTSPPTCDRTQPFGKPVRVAELDANGAFTHPRLSPDELTMYFTQTTATTSSDLVMAVRASKSAPFGAPTVLPQSTMDAENDPSVGADNLTLWFHSTRSGSSADIFFATRTATMGPFGTAAVVPTVNGDMTIEATPYFRSAANELWFVSERTGSQLLDIYVSTRTGDTFSDPLRNEELSSASDELLPQPSEDGLTVILASDRTGGQGKQDIWIAHRATTSAKFDVPVALTEINSDQTDEPGWLSADGCRIWFSSGRETADAHQQIFFAKRP